MKTTSDRLKQLMKDRNLRQVDILNMSKPYQKKLGIKMSKSHLSQYVNGKSSPDQHKLYLLSKVLDVGEAWLMGYDVDPYRVPDEERQKKNISISLHQDIIENLDDLKESNAPLVNDFIEEIIKEQSNKSTFIPETARVQSSLSYSRQKRVLDFATEQLDEQNNKVLHINSNNIVSEEVAVYGFASAGTGETLIDGVEFTTQYNGHIPNHDFALQVNGDSMEPMFEDKEIIFIDETKQINSGQIGIFVIDGEAYLKKVFISDKGIRLVSLNSKYPDLHFDSSHDIKVAGKVIL
ncbi:S24 family peptidase [Staphylococcus delphini]|uniref:S24 family peptidase n=1 Tax=Staphylococcus delphini TaxID=53344 RepID=UPI0012D3572B|nr:S24 family peptidase [Staphylococcus delphini]MTV20917.1 helix-turn-helix domain-containing protein [Staphylococcus delphini]